MNHSTAPALKMGDLLVLLLCMDTAQWETDLPRRLHECLGDADIATGGWDFPRILNRLLTSDLLKHRTGCEGTSYTTTEAGKQLLAGARVFQLIASAYGRLLCQDPTDRADWHEAIFTGPAGDQPLRVHIRRHSSFHVASLTQKDDTESCKALGTRAIKWARDQGIVHVHGLDD